jgi:hypothetical protein
MRRSLRSVSWFICRKKHYLPPGGFSGGGLVMGGKLLVFAQFVIGGRLVIGQLVTAGTGMELVGSCREVTAANPLVGEVKTGLSCSSPLQVGLKVGGMVSSACIWAMQMNAGMAMIRGKVVVFIVFRGVLLNIIKGVGADALPVSESRYQALPSAGSEGWSIRVGISRASWWCSWSGPWVRRHGGWLVSTSIRRGRQTGVRWLRRTSVWWLRSAGVRGS